MHKIFFNERLIGLNDWATIVFLVAFIAIAVNRNIFGPRFNEFVRLGVSDKYTKIYKESANIRSGFTVSLFFVQMISLSFFVLLLLSQFYHKEKHDGVLYIQIFTFLTVFILSKYLKDKGVAAEVHEISGSVEIAPSIGLADAICDLVSSGSTLFSNGLQEAETILSSEAVLVATNSLDAQKQQIIDRLLFRIESVKKAKKNKYVLLNAPNANLDKIISLLPGMKSPTVVALATPGWSSVHSVIAESDFWDIIEKLKLAGAEGILVVPIEKMIL